MKKSKQKQESITESKKCEWTKFSIGKIVALIVFIVGSGTVCQRYEKHEDIERSLSRIVNIISDADKQVVPDDIDLGWLVFQRLTKKLEFILLAQKQHHSDSYIQYDQRFVSTNGWSFKSTLEMAADTFLFVEKNHHKSFNSLLAKANWEMVKAELSSSQSFSNTNYSVPTALLAFAKSINYDASGTLKKEGIVAGVIVKSLPKSLRKSSYVVVDLTDVEAQQAMLKMQVKVPADKRYFLPSFEEIERVEKVTGTSIMPLAKP